MNKSTEEIRIPSNQLLKFIESKAGGVEEHLQCAGCDEIVNPMEATFCTSGHFVCNPCLGINHICPKRITQISTGQPNELIRCGATFLREQQPPVSPILTFVCNHFLINCPYAALGCTGTLFVQNLKSHKMTCPYRPPHCLFSRCEQPLTKESYSEHLKTHFIQTFDTNSHRVRIENGINKTKEELKEKLVYGDYNRNYWPSALFNCFDLTFILMVEKRESSLYMWITLTSDLELGQRKRFRWVLTFVPTPTSRAKLTWPGIVVPFTSALEDVMTNSEHALIEKGNLFKNFVTKTQDTEFFEVDVLIYDIQEKNSQIEEDLIDFDSDVLINNPQTPTVPLPAADVMERSILEFENDELVCQKLAAPLVPVKIDRSSCFTVQNAEKDQSPHESTKE